jgi:hypothetical protein
LFDKFLCVGRLATHCLLNRGISISTNGPNLYSTLTNEGLIFPPPSSLKISIKKIHQIRKPFSPITLLPESSGRNSKTCPYELSSKGRGRGRENTFKHQRGVDPGFCKVGTAHYYYGSDLSPSILCGSYSHITSQITGDRHAMSSSIPDPSPIPQDAYLSDCSAEKSLIRLGPRVHTCAAEARTAVYLYSALDHLATTSTCSPFFDFLPSELSFSGPMSGRLGTPPLGSSCL